MQQQQQYKKRMTAEVLLKLKNKLPRNYRKEIVTRLAAKGLRFSEGTIYMVLVGARTNEKIIEEAIALANEREEYLATLNDDINKL